MEGPDGQLYQRRLVNAIWCLRSPPHPAGLRQELHAPYQVRMRLQAPVQLVRAGMQVLRDATSNVKQQGATSQAAAAVQATAGRPTGSMTLFLERSSQHLRWYEPPLVRQLGCPPGKIHRRHDGLVFCRDRH